MSDSNEKPEEQVSQTEAPAEEEVKPEAEESAEKAKPEADESKSKADEAAEDGAPAEAKSGVEADATKSKAQSSTEAAKSATQSGIDAPKSATKSKVKSEVKASKSTKSKSSSKRGSSGTGSQVEAKPSRSQSGSRSKVADVCGARIGIIGAGRMAESIVKGLLKADKIKPKQLFVAAKTSKNLDTFKVQGITTTSRSYDVFGKFDCDVIFMAVHGFVVRNCFKLGGTRPLALTTNFIPTRKRPTYILSLIGGIPLADLKSTLLNPETEKRYKVEMHRLVLNTSVAYGLGLGALDVEIDSKKCAPLIRDILQSMAKVELVAPELMDAVCTVAGNGSAFVYYFISALADGGVKMGLNKLMAIKLATKTIQSAAQTLLETNKGPAELRDDSTSPSGGAIYGIHVLDKQDCASGIQAAIDASYRRLKELVDVSN